MPLPNDITIYVYNTRDTGMNPTDWIIRDSISGGDMTANPMPLYEINENQVGLTTILPTPPDRAYIYRGLGIIHS